MPDTPSRLLWIACGSTPSPKAGALPSHLAGDWSRCWVCAGETHGRGSPIADWDGANFTGQTRVRYPRGQAICEPCLWVMARNSDVPGLTGNWRNYSVLYAEGEPLTIKSKGDKPAVLAWLRRPHRAPWFAALANSGQKHVVPYVPTNGAGRARALFDEELIDLPRDSEGWRIVDDLAALLTAGATKDEVERGEYAGALSRCESEVRAFERAYGHLRGSGWFALVVFLAQRDEAEVAARLGREASARAEKKAREKEAAKAARPTRATKPVRAKETKRGAKRGDEGSPLGCDGGRGDGATPPVPRWGSERPEALGPDHRPDARGDEDVRGPGGVGHEAVQGPPDRGPVQLALFGGGDADGDGAPQPRRSERVARARRA